MAFDEAVKAGLIETMGEETDRKFMANVTAMINDQETVAQVADTFKLVYTPFHGCGYKLVPEALRTLGIKHLICVPEQMVIDGNFPTVVSPNPENPEGFYLAIDLAKENDVDFILGTDPDSDRVGIMVRNHDGEFQPVTGNQTGVLLLDYLIGAMRRSGKLPEKPVALKTIVTTEMARKVAESQRRDVLRYLHRLQIHGGKEERPGGQRRGQGHLLLRGVLRLHAGRLRPGQGRRHRLHAPDGDGRLVRRPGHDPL